MKNKKPSSKKRAADKLSWLSQVRPSPQRPNGLSDAEKRERIEKSVTDILETLGMDLENDSLADTPKRIAKMYVDEVFSGLNPANVPKITTINNDMQYDQMIVVRDIAVLSTCEHHFQTIEGRAVVAYIPTQKVIGLSKINRIVDFFARRPQVQERLTKQIADALETLLETPHVAVSIRAKHYCVIARGIRDVSSSTSTTEVRGDFRQSESTREEFLTHCKTDFC
jgi:GTP cyclohydrolase I